MWNKGQWILYYVLWIYMVEIRAATLRSRKSAFEQIELVNSGYALYNDLGRIFQVDMKIPWKRHNTSNQGSDTQGAAIRGDVNNLWENGIIPYKLAYSIRKTTQTHKILMGAMREWEKKTCIKFVERVNQPDYVEFYYGEGCNSDVGRVGGRQTTSLGRGCAHHGIIVHELGHVIGFWHEQNRPDRNKHVDIMWENIIPKFQFAFSMYNNRKINSLGVPYDYYSVMHYGSKAFSKNHKPTIMSRKQDVTEFGNTHISPLDAKQANLLYKCPDYPKFPSEFFWKNDGPGHRDSSCVNFNEPQDPYNWHDNYLCFRKDRKALNIRWSHTGPLLDMNCIKVEVPTKSHKYYWNDNYLCWPRDGAYTFSWISRPPSPTELGNCLNITEPNDPEWSKRQYFLCASRDESPVDGQWSEWAPWTKCSRQCGDGMQRRVRTCTSPPPSFGGSFCSGQSLETRRCNVQQCEDWPVFPSDFTFGRFKYFPQNKLCIRTYERLDYLTWNDYIFCTPNNKRDLKFRWSDKGSIPDNLCTRIYVRKEVTKRKGTWDDNYLCMPKNDAPYRFRFSYSGPISGIDCMPWRAKGGQDGWDKTFLCAERTQVVGASRPSISVARPVHGRWSLWSTWSSCSQTCGGGVQRRRRFCNNPRPLNGGRNCQGRNVDERACNSDRCPMACGGRLDAYGGRFTSPDYPRNYPDNSVCEWVIKVPQGKIISLRFIYIDIEGPACRYDYVVIRDGPTEKYPRLGKFCGRRLPRTIKSSGNHLWIKFKSDDRTNYKGFDITWVAKPDPITSAGRVLPRCGGMVTKSHGSLSSPVLSSAYQSGLDCTWVIKGDEGKRLHVWLDQFDIHSNCRLDYVEIKDGQGENSPSMGTYCGSKTPAPFKSHSNSIRIKLHITSKRRKQPRFRVRWRSVDLVRILPTTPPARNNCPDGWVSHSFGGNRVYCYLVKRNYHTWFEARRDCIQSNADLLSVMSKEEENFIIKDLNKNFNLGESFMWIGLNDHNREGQWAWSDRTQKSYHNWAPGDPNDGGYLKNEDCGVLKPDGQWNDYPCNSRFRYICKARSP